MHVSYLLTDLSCFLQDAANPLFFEPSANSINSINSLTARHPDHNFSQSQPASEVQQHGQQRVRHSSNTKAPRLRVSESAPNMAIVDESPSQAHVEPIRPKSFHLFPAGYDGDTQPMPSQVYKDYHKSMYATMQKAKAMADADNDFTQYTTQQDGSMAGGESGHVDLMQHMQDTQGDGPHIQEISSDEESGDDNTALGDETQDLLSSVNRPTYPKTPATAGRKRSHRGDPISAASTRTPGSGLSAYAAFGNAAPVMSASQMFHATQAVSSPLQDAPRSDPVFTRPSPNMRNHSSPMLNFESPLLNAQAGQDRAITEPRDTHLTMEESQARQMAIMGGRQYVPMSANSLRSWDGAAGPGRTPSRQNMDSPDYGVHVPRITFRRSVSRDRDVIELPDEEEESPEIDPMDEYDELAQDVRPSQRDDWLASEADDQDDAQGDDQDDEDYQEDQEEHDKILSSPQKSPFPLQTDHEARESDVQQESPLTNHEPEIPHSAGNRVSEHSTIDFAVADSQPGRQETQPPPFPIAPSSLSSVVPASQLPSTSLHGQGVVDSSSIPKPPPLTNQVINNPAHKRMRSSPPRLSQVPAQEDVVSNDEGADTAPSSKLDTDAVSNSQRMEDASPLAIGHVHLSQDKLPPRSSREGRSSAIPETDPPDGNDKFDSHSAHNTSNDTEVVAFSRNTSNKNEQSTLSKTTSGISEAAPADMSGQKQDSDIVAPSPRKHSGILRFADITTDPTPPDPLNDIDIDILTADDKDYLKAMDSSVSEPANKRLRMYGKKGKRENARTMRAATKSPAPTTGSPDRDQSETLHSSSVVPEQAANPGVLLNTAHQSSSENKAIEAVADEPAQPIEMPKQPPVPLETARAHEKTPSKESLPVLPKVMPTPALALVREKKIEDRFVSISRDRTPVRNASNNETVSSKPGKLSRIKSKSNGRASVRQTPRAVPTRSTIPEIAETPQSNPLEAHRLIPEPIQEDTEMRDNNDVEVAPVVQQDTKPTTSDAAPSISLPPDAPTKQDCSEILAPGRVFALFKGTGQAYYPATCLGSSTLDGQKLRVRFDDDTTTQLEPHVVRRLELRRGDQVKVDLPGLRNKVYIVTGFRDQLEASSEELDPKTDIHGFKAVQLAAKERDSLAGIPTPSAAASLTIPITHLYLTHTMFVKFEDRAYALPRSSATGRSSRHSTPVSETVVPTTPGSRSRRPTLLTGGSIARSDFASPMISADGVFGGMAFAVSYSANNSEKDRVLNLIQRNGGLVLEQGFDELFNVLELSDSEAPSPSKSKHRPSPAPTDDSTEGVEALTLSSRAKSLGFVALIADKHSRRAKYVQALALSLPCLSGRWVIDSAAAGTAAQWPKYLLPAGESAYLYGAIRSRTLTPYDVTSAKLTDTFRTRDRLLQGGRVLLVGQGGKVKWESRKAYAFLTIALGATNVRRVGSLDAAKQILEQEGEMWKWVYVDGKIDDAERELFGVIAGEGDAGGAKVASRKRKRGDADVGVGKDKMVASNGKVKIVGDEFVVQSLILGSLLEG